MAKPFTFILIVLKQKTNLGEAQRKWSFLTKTQDAYGKEYEKEGGINPWRKAEASIAEG